MKFFKKTKTEPISVTSERCITESEFDRAIDNLVSAWVKALKAADGAENMKEVGKAIAGRIAVLEQLNAVLFEGGVQNVKN